MPIRLLLATLVWIAAAAGPAAAQEPVRSPLFGALAAGAHDVGFTRIQIADATRPVRRHEEGAEGSPAARARRIDVHVWYPARRGSGIASITFADAMVAHLVGRPAAERTRRDADLRRFLSQFGPIPDDAWARLRAAPMLSRPDAAADEGRYPLLIGVLRPLSTAVTNEFLASHGYVVAMVDGEDAAEPQDSGAALDVDRGMTPAPTADELMASVEARGVAGVLKTLDAFKATGPAGRYLSRGCVEPAGLPNPPHAPTASPFPSSAGSSTGFLPRPMRTTRSPRRSRRPANGSSPSR